MTIKYKMKLEDGTTIFTLDDGFEKAFKTASEFQNFIKTNGVTRIIL